MKITRKQLDESSAALTAEQRDKVCQGLLCPHCKGDNIKNVGCNPDGINRNEAYDCQNPECGAEWEGY